MISEILILSHEGDAEGLFICDEEIVIVSMIM